MYARGDKEGRVEIKTIADSYYRETPPTSGLTFNRKVNPHGRISKAKQINTNKGSPSVSYRQLPPAPDKLSGLFCG